MHHAHKSPPQRLTAGSPGSHLSYHFASIAAYEHLLPAPKPFTSSSLLVFSLCLWQPHHVTAPEASMQAGDLWQCSCMPSWRHRSLSSRPDGMRPIACETGHSASWVGLDSQTGQSAEGPAAEALATWPLKI